MTLEENFYGRYMYICILSEIHKPNNSSAPLPSPPPPPPNNSLQEMAAEASQLITPTEGTRLVVLEGRGNEEAEPVADEKPKVWPKVGPDGRFIDPVEQWEAEHQNDEPTVRVHVCTCTCTCTCEHMRVYIY